MTFLQLGYLFHRLWYPNFVEVGRAETLLQTGQELGIQQSSEPCSPPADGASRQPPPLPSWLQRVLCAAPPFLALGAAQALLARCR